LFVSPAPLTLVVTPGMGIGPEVTARALVNRDWSGRVVLIGEGEPMRLAAAAAGLRLRDVDGVGGGDCGDPGTVDLWVPESGPEPVPITAIRCAAKACLAGTATAMVTGPIHKARLVAQGFAHKGHTELLGEICGVARPVMAFAGGRLRVALVTTHIPLDQVRAEIRVDRVIHTVRVAEEALRRDLGIARPRIAVTGLNPHAGEDGVLGDAEQVEIGPACDQLRRDGLNVLGPVSAETAFMDMYAERLDLVVAMYHDQGLVPLKMVDFGRSVNWTLGLPIVRTSVDHGTADALVGTGEASPASMAAALRLASEIARVQRRIPRQ
jgi:4-hydroxythreonine-4-phosphate dehydrogenase